MKNYTDEQLKFITDGTQIEPPLVIADVDGSKVVIFDLDDLRHKDPMRGTFELAESVFEAKGHSWDDEDWLDQMRKYTIAAINYLTDQPVNA